MKQLRVYFHGLDTDEPLLLGRLGYGRGQGYTHFEMDSAFLRLGINPSPLRLETRTGLQPAPQNPFDGLHGLFNDSLPDGWGRYLMDRAFRQRGLDPDAVTPLLRLASVGARAMGALSYEPDDGGAAPPHVAPMDLAAIGLAATRQYLGDASELLDSLVRHASPSGGARPKILIGINDTGRLRRYRRRRPAGTATATGWPSSRRGPQPPTGPPAQSSTCTRGWPAPPESTWPKPG